MIKTLGRPVPLEHYIYTGRSDETSYQLFKVISADSKNFSNTGYDQARDAMKKRRKKPQKESGPKHKHLTDGAERNLLISFVRMLEKKDKLPVVMFILSKARINKLAQNLKSLNLTTAKEKGRIPKSTSTYFFEIIFEWTKRSVVITKLRISL